MYNRTNSFWGQQRILHGTYSKADFKEIGIDYLIATNIDKHTGKFTGNNCYGEEKVVRFYEKFGNIEPASFYSDSLSDTPMAEISKKSYLIKNDKVLDWPKR